MLLNLNSGLLTDNDADCGSSTEPRLFRVGRRGALRRGSSRSWRRVVWALELNLDGGDNMVFLKGGDGTGAAICDVIFGDADPDVVPPTLRTAC